MDKGPNSRILKGSEELFFRHGIRSVTMDDIARHLGMSKKTIYQYYRDKKQIVHDLMKLDLEEQEKDFCNITTGSENIVEEVFGFMKHITGIFSQRNPGMFYDLQKYYPNTWKLFKDFKEKCVMRMVEETLQKGIKDGYVRKDINTRILARLRIEEIEMGLNPEIFPPDKFNMLDIQLEMLQHFLYGICTLRGHKLINKFKDVVEEE